MEGYQNRAFSPQQPGSIRNIVQLVQSGKLKSDSPLTAEHATFPQGAPIEDDDRSRRSEGSHSSSKLTSESRWLLIKQLAQRKAQRQEAAAAATRQGYDVRSSAPNNGSFQDVTPGQEDYYSSETDNRFRPNSYNQQQQSQAPGADNFDDSSWLEKPQQSQSPSGGRRRSQSADPRDRISSPNSNVDTSFVSSPGNRSRQYDDGMSLSYMDDARSYRIAQNEAALRNEVYKECTFQPRLYTSETSRSRNKDLETPFHQRVARWQSTKDAEIVKRKQAIDRIEVESCTFKPKLNANSVRAATELRNGGMAGTGHDLSPEVSDVATRLHKSYEESLMLKAKYIELELKRVQDEEIRSCTFQPNISTTHSKFHTVRPKYHLEETYKQNKPTPIDPSSRECTFTPKVTFKLHFYSIRCYLKLWLLMFLLLLMLL